MPRPTTLPTRRALTAAIVQRYQAADRQSKKAILDEFVKITGYHRKHAIRILGDQPLKQQKKPIGQRVYQAAAEEALIILWEAADRICGKRLKALLPILIEAMERYGHLQLDEFLRAQLLQMSAATMDRRLQKVRQPALGTKRKKRRLNRVRKLVAVKTFADWTATRAG